jgi:hypothetical protein
VAHYLIKKSDVNVARSLAVFLAEKDYFKILLQTIPSFGSDLKWARFNKMLALQKYVGNIVIDKSVDGYDSNLKIRKKRITNPKYIYIYILLFTTHMENV